MHLRPDLINPPLDWLSAMDSRQFKLLFKGSPLQRTGRKRLLRNVAIAMGNSGEARFLPQLDAWAAGDPITLRDVEQLAAGRAETSIFSLTDAWGRRDVGAVLRAAEEIMERSYRPRSGELMRMIASLVNHVGRVRRCQRLADEGIRAKDAAGRLKMHPFAAEKAFAQAASFSPEELADAVVRLADLDAAAKGGSRMPADLEFERALIQITR